MDSNSDSRTITSSLQSAIESSNESRYAISRSAGVQESSLSLFVRGRRSLRLDKVDLLAEYLGLELVKRGADRSRRARIRRGRPS